MKTLTIPTLISTILFFSPIIGVAQKDIKKQCEEFVKNPPSGSIAIKGIIANELSKNASHKVILEISEPQKLSSAYIALQNTTRLYNKKVKQNEIISTILRTNNEMVKYIVSLAGKKAPTPMTLIVGKTLSYITDKGLDKIADEFDKWTQKSAQNVFSYGINSYRVHEGNLNNLIGKSAKEIIISLNEKGYLPGLTVDLNLSEGAKLIGLNAMINDLAIMDRVILEDLANKGEEIENLDLDVKILWGSSQKLWEMAEETNRKVERIGENITIINKHLNSLNHKVSNNSKDILKNKEDIDYLQSFLFGKMSPSERKEALNNGFFSGMPLEKRKELEEKINLEDRHQQVIDDMKSYINTAGQLLNIANNLGFKGEFASDLGKAVQAGQYLVEGIAALNTPNGWLAATSSFSNILGIGKSGDAAGKRQEQLVSMLNQVLRNQQIMNTKLDQILENQGKMLENQVKIYSAIVELSVQTQENYRNLMTAINQLNTDVMINREGINELLNYDYTQCWDILRARTEQTSKQPIENLINLVGAVNLFSFNGYEEITQHYLNNSKQPLKPFPTCMNYLASTVSISDGSPHSRFSADYYFPNPNSNSRYRNFLNSYWPQQVQTLNNVINKNGLKFEQIFLGLINPISRSGLFDTIYLDGLNSFVMPDRLQTFSSLIKRSSLIEVYYSYEATRNFTKIFYEFLPYWEMVDPENDQKLLSFDELLENKNSDLLIRRRIKDLLLRLDILIAQQSLLAGSALIPYYYKVFNSPKDSDKALKRDLIYLLSRNERLAYNFLIYALRKEVEKSKGYLGYNLAVNAVKNDDQYLKQILDNNSNWKVIWMDSTSLVEKGYSTRIKWCIEFIDDFTEADKNKHTSLIIPLPSPSELKSGLLHYSDELHGAIEMRSLLLDYLEGFDFIDLLPSYQKINVTKAMLYNSSSN